MRFILVATPCLFICAALVAQQPQTPIAGKVLSVQGTVEVERPPWIPAQVEMELNAGETVRTGARSRAAVLLADETQLKLGSNSQLQLNQIRPTSNLVQRVAQSTPDTEESQVNLRAGKAWLRARKRPARVRVRTPSVTAAIRGTEFVLEVAPDGESVMTVLEGVVDMSNDQGSILVNSGEQGRARIGQAPTKTVILNPEDAVQWTLFYSASVSPRDHPFRFASQLQAVSALASPPSDPVQLAQLQFDAGQLDAALATLGGVTSPEAAEVRGWVELARNDVSQAVAAFDSGSSDRPRTRLGLSIAHYRVGEVAQAYELVEFPQGNGSLMVQKALLELISGEVDLARSTLEAVASSDAAQSLVQGMLSNILLAQNETAGAREAAQRAVDANSESPSALLNLSLVEQAELDLAAATRSARAALDLDPDFLQAQVQYSRLLFGAGENRRALQLMQDALESAPEEATVHSLLGFILLSRASTAEAVLRFEEALRLDSSLGEPHLGLGIALMRQGDYPAAVAEILIASTLQPRLAIYQSYLGKAFYEERKFEQAFEALQSASELDERDPTPHLYAGIFQEDQNRPGVAIDEFRESIALNDNRAVYRSQFLLDEDRATRNVQLARAYNRLGLAEWGNLEAVKSNASDPTNSSARFFLANTFLNLRGRTAAAGSELLVGRLMMPVNANSFNSFNDYTTLYEQPRLDLTAGGAYGSFATVDGDFVATGGTDRIAFGSVFAYDKTDGFRDGNDGQKAYTTSNTLKIALTPETDILLGYAFQQQRLGDVGQLVVTDEVDNEDIVTTTRLHRFELGLHHQFRVGSEVIVHASRRVSEVVTDDGLAVGAPSLVLQCRFAQMTSPPCGFFDRRTELDTPSLDVQAAHLYKIDRFQVQYGVDFFGGRTRNVVQLSNGRPPFGPPINGQDPQTVLDTEVKFRTGFFQADYELLPSLTVTGGLNYDWANDDNVFVVPGDLLGLEDNGNPILAENGTTKQWNPRAGALFSPIESGTFRFAFFRALQPLVSGAIGGAFIKEQLEPTHVNGFVVSFNEIELARSETFSAGWDQRIGRGTFIRTTAFWRDRTIPTSEFDRFTGIVTPTEFTGEWYGGSVVWNQLLGDRFTVVGEYTLDDVDDLSAYRRDHNGRVGITFVDHRGLSMRLSERYFKQNGRIGNASTETKVFTTDLAISWEFPRKFGLLSVRVNNIFDRRYSYIVDPFSLDRRIPKRQYVASLAFYF